MRGDTSDNNLEVDTGGASGERRPSVVALQNMLKKVSQSPFNNRNVQDGVDGTPVRKNPFYEYYLSGSNAHQNESSGATASQSVAVDPVLSHPPEFQSPPSARWPEVTTLGGVFPEPQTQTDSRASATANGHSLSATSDLFGPVLAGSLPQTSGASDLSRAEVDHLFRPARKEEPFPFADPTEVGFLGGSRSVLADPFKPLEKSDDLFQSPAPRNPFYTTPTSGDDLFQAAPAKSEELFSNQQNNHDVASESDLFGLVSKKKMDPFSTSSTDTVDPFQSPIATNLFQDVSHLDDPFGPSPLVQKDPFYRDNWGGTQDLLQPAVPKSQGLSEMALGSPASADSFSTPSVSSPGELRLDAPSSPDFLKKTPSRPAPPPVPPKPSKKPPAVILTTPGETEHDVLPPTPFSRTRNLAMSSVRSSASKTQLQSLKRPPKPLPRTKPPKPDDPTKPERPPPPSIPAEPEPSAPIAVPKPVFKPLPKPVLRLKPKTPEKKVNSEDFVVFEDILLIGQECCVEDWPDDSPEVDPHFKPSGKLRLRRESLKVKLESEGGSGEEQDVSGGSSKKKDRKFRMSLLSRRSSKEKFPDDVETRSRTLPMQRKSSKDYFLDLPGSTGEFEDDDQVDYKKKPLKTKVNQLLRRASTNSAVLQGKQANGQSPQDWRDDGVDKKKGTKKDSVRRWSEGTVLDGSTGEDEEGGDVQQGEKKQKKLKIKFVPRRGYTIGADKMSDESKGACGYTPRKGSKADMLDETASQKMKGACSVEDLDADEFYHMDDDKRDGFPEDELMGKDVFSPKETFDSEPDEVETCKPKKQLKLKVFKKQRSKNKSLDFEGENIPGATSSDFLSEAAQAEWDAAQRDARGLEGEDEDEDGDTDSLMEWWNTVERWDELPSDEEDEFVKEDESKSFSVLADKVQRGLRVFNKVFTERAEVLWHSIITIFAIADDISDFHQKAKIAGITGGTTTAVGGVTAIAGLALAPFTFGASLVITAVGVGVATAGGIASASAAISDNVNNMNDRKKVEVVLEEYEGHLLDISKILHFINQGVYRLRGHPFLRSGTQHYSEDWETRRAVQLISQVDSPVMRAAEVTDGALASLQGLFKGMDKYFIKDSRELKKGCRKEVVAQIRELGNVLNDAIIELNAIREELQDATGNF